jgi:hypothetical protein
MPESSEEHPRPFSYYDIGKRIENPPIPEPDPALLKELEAHISWQTIKQEVGNSIVAFQLLESAIKDAISYLLNEQDLILGRIVTSPVRFREMLGVLYALFAHKHPESDDLEKLKSILGQCDDCNIARNKIVHSYWTPDDALRRPRRLCLTMRGPSWARLPTHYPNSADSGSLSTRAKRRDDICLGAGYPQDQISYSCYSLRERSQRAESMSRYNHPFWRRQASRTQLKSIV